MGAPDAGLFSLLSFFLNFSFYNAIHFAAKSKESAANETKTFFSPPPTEPGKLLSLILPSLAEPIGGAAPKFSSDSKSLGNFEKSSAETLALLCPAQASPLPSFK